MSKKSFIDSVKVGSPCSEDWNQMQGTDKIRLCSHCVKHVNNLSEMTRKEATRLVRGSNGNICIRYIVDPVTKRPMFAEQLFQITRRTPGIAAGVMTASISLSTFAHAQDSVKPQSDPVVVQTNENKDRLLIKQGEVSLSKPDIKPMASISGSVVDPVGAVIQNAKVTIFSVDAGKTESTTTNEEGVYKFEKLEPGTYRIESESPGFKKTVTQVVVSEAKETVSDASLSIGMEITVDVVADVQMEVGMALGGVMVSVEYSSPLNRAVANDDVEEVRDLIVKGADVNGKDENYDKLTPLFIAVENGNLEIAETLLKFGAKVNARDREKQTPLMRLDGDATLELVELLVRYGAKLNLTDNDGNTAIMIAADGAKPEVLKALVDAGADVRLANKEGQTALMNAASSGALDGVRILIQAGAEVNAKNKKGETAWDQTTNEEIEALLVSFGAEAHPSVNKDDPPPPPSR